MIAIVTGGGRGIGAATAQIFAEHGYDVLISSRSKDELEKTRLAIAAVAPKQKVGCFTCDISIEKEVNDLFTYCQDFLGTPSVLINNAAMIKVTKFTAMSIAEWDQVHAVNIRGTMLCCKQAFDYMRKSGGSIVNLSSLGGVSNTEKFPGFVSYSASKAAVIGFTQALAVEGKEFGIRVNCVAPGAVNTQMLAYAAPGLKTTVNPADIAKSIYCLADARYSRHITGSVLEVFSND